MGDRYGIVTVDRSGSASKLPERGFLNSASLQLTPKILKKLFTKLYQCAFTLSSFYIKRNISLSCRQLTFRLHASMSSSSIDSIHTPPRYRHSVSHIDTSSRHMSQSIGVVEGFDVNVCILLPPSCPSIDRPSP